VPNSKRERGLKEKKKKEKEKKCHVANAKDGAEGEQGKSA